MAEIIKLARFLLINSLKGDYEMSWEITRADIRFLSLGAKFLGCGGGGDPATTALLLESIMAENKPIKVLSLFELTDEFVVVIVVMGSPVLYSEMLPNGEEGLQSLERYEQFVNQQAEALISLEIGGLNALTPLVVAAERKLPVIDGDGMGRAFPELHMSAFQANNLTLSPIVLTNQKNQLEVLTDQNDFTLANKAHEWVNQMGGVAHAACYGAEASFMKSAMIPGSLKLIYQLGKAVLEESVIENKLSRLKEVFTNSMYGNPLLLTSGQVKSVKRWFHQGNIEGEFTILGSESFTGIETTIQFKNEFIAVKDGNGTIVTTPDLILVLHSENLHPCLIEDIQEDLPVTVLGVPAPNILRTYDMLHYVGPRAFGIDQDYRPIVTRNEKRL